MKKCNPLLLTLCAALSIPAWADHVTLKNGDRISGAIVKSDKKTLVLQSEFLGRVEIQWDAVTALQADKAIFVGIEGGQTVVGTVSASEGRFAIQTESAGTVNTEKEKVLFIRNSDEQRTQETQIERLRNPRLVDLWTGFVDLGFAQATGNSITSTISSSANAVRATSRDKITTTFQSLYSRNNSTGTSFLAANSIRGGVAYSLDVSKKMFAYGSTELEFDEFQKLDLRFVPAGGFGYHAKKTANTVLDLFGGGSLNKEFFATGLRRSSGEAQFGDELVRKVFGGVTTLRQKLVIYPNLTNRGEFRMNFDLSQATAFRRWLSWQVSFSNRYISNPVEGRKTNDLVMTTGFRITFAP